MVLLLALTACSGSEDPGEPDGAAGGGGTPGAGGVPVSPGASGGSPGSGGQPVPPGGNGGSPSGQEEACQPDVGIADIGPSCLFDMDAEDLGLPDDPEVVDVFSRELREPVTAGQPYALSFKVRGPGHTFELWGATAHSTAEFYCGVATELLVSREIPGEGSYCVDFVATQDHEYWLEVIRGGGEGGLRTDINYCANTTCP